MNVYSYGRRFIAHLEDSVLEASPAMPGLLQADFPRSRGSQMRGLCLSPIFSVESVSLSDVRKGAFGFQKRE